MRMPPHSHAHPCTYPHKCPLHALPLCPGAHAALVQGALPHFRCGHVYRDAAADQQPGRSGQRAGFGADDRLDATQMYDVFVNMTAMHVDWRAGRSPSHPDICLAVALMPYPCPSG
eukprot:365017-Chlamydomonas_euryale.AAC.5